jgi:hypothetical protein
MPFRWAAWLKPADFYTIQIEALVECGVVGEYSVVGKDRPIKFSRTSGIDKPVIAYNCNHIGVE